MITKGVNYATHELRQELIDLINSSGLPPCNVVPIIEDIYNQCKAQEAQAVKKEREEYEKALKDKAHAEVLNNGNDN